MCYIDCDIVSDHCFRLQHTWFFSEDMESLLRAYMVFSEDTESLLRGSCDEKQMEAYSERNTEGKAERENQNPDDSYVSSGDAFHDQYSYVACDSC